MLRVSRERIYSTIAVAASLGLIAYLFMIMVPNLAKVFHNLNVSMPWYTTALIETSSFLQDFWLFMIIALVGLWFTFKKRQQ